MQNLQKSLYPFISTISKYLFILLALAVAGLSSLAWVLLHGDANAKTAVPELIRPAKIITVQSVSPVRAINLPALVQASRSTDLTFEVAGSLQQLLVEPGDDVSRGQVIARLDRRKFSNEVVAAQAQYNNAITEYRRAERLVGKDALARSVFEQRKAQLAIARSSLDTAKIQRDDTVLRAPFTGVIADVTAERFENVGPGTPIAVLQTQGRAEAVIQVPAAIVANSGQIRPIETVLTLDAAPDRQIATRLKSVTTQANPQTQSFEGALISLRLNEGKAAQLPRISLTGSIGGASSELDRLLNPANVLWQLASNIVTPLFDAGRLKAQVEGAQAIQAQAIASYAASALNAFREVEAALDGQATSRRRAIAIGSASAASERALGIARLRYSEGEEDLLDVLSIQQAAFQSRSALIAIERSQLDTYIQLSLALGGHWSAD